MEHNRDVVKCYCPGCEGCMINGARIVNRGDLCDCEVCTEDDEECTGGPWLLVCGLFTLMSLLGFLFCAWAATLAYEASNWYVLLVSGLMCVLHVVAFIFGTSMATKS